MTKKIIKRYSTAFKQQVVKEYEKGANIYALQKKYGINGNGTIRRWIERYSLKGLRHKLMIIQSPEEQNQVKELEKQIVQLEKAVARLTLDKLMLETALETVEKEWSVDVKKNGVPKSYKEPTSEVKNKENT